MKNVAFTICAKNYIGLAQVLEKSIKTHNPDVDFFIFIADEIDDDDEIAEDLADNILIAKDTLDIKQDEWFSMAFKYDLTEFCTAIKPSCFKYLFDNNENVNCIYFDPDIFVFSSLNLIYNELVYKTFVITPHILTIEKLYTGDLKEYQLLFSGIYNLGFIAIKKNASSIRMLDWWELRLKDRCYRNMLEHYFTDQKWIDFLPALFPNEVVISDNLGMNLAPWNFYERKIELINSEIYVRNRIEAIKPKTDQLIFVHYSGFNYKELIENNLLQQNLKNFVVSEDLMVIFQKYAEALLQSSLIEYLKLKYSYNTFSNSTYISLIYRKLYKSLWEDQILFSNPFDAEKSFFKSLKQAKLINKSVVVSDKTSINNASNVDNKISLINKLFTTLYRVVGVNKYFQIVRLLRFYARVENHTFIVGKQYFKKLKSPF